MINIANIKTFVNDGSTIPIKIDRTSVLGNPFPLYKSEDRDDICDKYETYFWYKINTGHDKKFIAELDRIQKICRYNDITLLCWCYPKRCHGETIKKYLEGLLYD